jgi:hypothetical protein
MAKGSPPAIQMAAKRSSLTIPTAVENAYILLLGQVTLVISQTTIYLFAAIFDEGNKPVAIDQVFTAALLISVSVMMAANILLGWMSCRDVLSKYSEYSNRLLTVDILFLLVFFMMNNVLSFDASFMLKSSGSINFPLLQVPTYLERGVHTYAPFLIYCLSIVVSLLYIWWNSTFGRLADEAGEGDRVEAQLKLKFHNLILCVAVFVQAGLAIMSLLYPAEQVARRMCLAFWIMLWIAMNGVWLMTTPTTSKHLAKK